MTSRKIIAPGLRLYALIFCATLAAYFPALKAGFIWNDADYVTKPALQSVGGLGRILFEVGATEQYYPLLHGAFWVEHRLWGDATLGYHLLNVLLHATSACLIVVFLRNLRRDPAAVAGAPQTAEGYFGTADAPALAGLLFALHPVCVESVAWVSEQKNTLSTVFYLLAAITYLNWAERRSGPAAYVFSLLLFVASILSKSVAATLPGALLVILWWKRGRLSLRRDFLPLAPFLAVGLAWGLFSAWVESTYVGAQGADFSLGALQRFVLAGRVAWFYLGKLAWPANLIFIYPRWHIDATAPLAWVYPVGLLLLLGALWFARSRIPGPLAALLFFLGSLFPLSGIFNAYGFIFSYVADHWQYLPMIGILALAAGGWERIAARRMVPAGILALATLCVLGVLTFRQCGLYREVETFYRRTIAGNPGCWMAHTNLGLILAESNRPDEAISEYGQALRLDPYRPEVIHNDLGVVLLAQGRLPEAAEQFREALRRDPGSPDYHRNLGNALLREGLLAEAVDQFSAAAVGDPGNSRVRNNLGIALAESGRSPEAIEQFQEAVRLEPGYVEAHFNLALALLRARRDGEARRELETVLRLNPDYEPARTSLRRLAAVDSGAANP